MALSPVVAGTQDWGPREVFGTSIRVAQLGTLPALNIPSDGGREASLLVLKESIEFPDSASDLFYRENIHKLSERFGTKARYQSLLATMRWSREDSAQSDDTVIDYSYMGMRRKAGELYRDRQMARAVTVEKMESIVRGTCTDSYDLFSAEGQLVRCILAESDAGARLDLAYTWACVAYSLLGLGSALEGVVEKLRSVAERSDVGLNSCVYTPMPMCSAFKHMAGRVIALQEAWVELVDAIENVRYEFWSGTCYIANICPLHGGPCNGGFIVDDGEAGGRHIRPLDYKQQTATSKKRRRDGTVV